MRLNATRSVTLSDALRTAKKHLDGVAGDVRATHVTATQGQSETYLAKAAEAQAFKDAGYPANVTAYPWIEAEMDAQGMTAQQAANMILNTRDAWLGIARQIEHLRLKGKRLASEATTISEIVAIRYEYAEAIKALKN